MKNKLLNKRKALKQKLIKNKNIQSNERIEILNEIKFIDAEVRRLDYMLRAGIKNDPPKSENEFNYNIDKYRYFSILKKLNRQYIKCNCNNFKIDDKVITSDNRIAFINEIIVYPEKVTRESSGIYVQLNRCNNDGSKSQKFIRKTRLDSLGFPIEDIKHFA